MTSHTKSYESQDAVRFTKEILESYKEILSEESIQFIVHLHRTFNEKRKALLNDRTIRQAEIDKGIFPNFLMETKSIRDADWQVAPIPNDLQDRRVEITGPVDRRMVINALNSGAKVFMADFEDANSPTWDNNLSGQINLRDAIRRQIDFVAENGKSYTLNENPAVLKVRPRGWHLLEKHMLIDGEQVSGSLFDFGLFFFHNAKELLNSGSGPYFYLPKLESHLEARLWNDVFVEVQQLLGIPNGSIKATVLIETILAAFEMNEIIYELKDHMAGLNAGRWDYIFSIIKKFKNHSDCILPDRSLVTMSSSFMRAYAKLLVKTCHKRGAHAMGGMSAFIPSRKDEAVNKIAFEKVQADKELEASTGFDGTWVAHPDLVPIAITAFNQALGLNPHQKNRLCEEYQIEAKDLLAFQSPNPIITEVGIRMNINVAILYINSWLDGVGAAAIHNLMEDAATAEISRAQVWQWLKHGAKTTDGELITYNRYQKILEEEIEVLKAELGSAFEKENCQKAISMFDEFVKQSEFDEFLTLNAYSQID
jgi:malate synthase